MCESLVGYYNGIKVVRYNLEQNFAPYNFITDTIKPLWQKYEPWATHDDVYQTVTRKVGRKIDILYDINGNVLGFYIFRIFRYGPWNVMFRGNSFISTRIRGIGVSLLNSAIKNYNPDRLVTFTSQERVYAFLSHFGEILPALNKKPSITEWHLLSRLAGSIHEVNKDTLAVCDFYPHKHEQQGDAVKNEYISNLFATLGDKDAYAVMVRCS